MGEVVFLGRQSTRTDQQIHISFVIFASFDSEMAMAKFNPRVLAVLDIT